MASLIWLTGLLVTVLGVGAVLHPAVLTGMLKAIRKTPFLFLTGGIRAAMGVLFLVFATKCHRPGIIITIGILLICSGVFVFVTPKARLNKMIDFVLRKPDWIRRMWGLVIIVIGSIIVWAGWLR